MTDILASSTHIVEAPLPALAAIECKTLSAFIQAVRLDGVLLAPVERHFTSHDAQNGWEVRFAIHLTGRSSDIDRAVCFATFPAAIVRGTGTNGQLVFPYQPEHLEVNLATEVCRLVNELQTCLVQVLESKPRLLGIRVDARYVLPDSCVWGVQSDASAEGIRFQDGHWVLHTSSGDRPQPAQDSAH